MSIKYLCRDCSILLGLSGSEAVNEVRRKTCEGCGDNRDNLVVVNAEECDLKIKQWNEENADG